MIRVGDHVHHPVYGTGYVTGEKWEKFNRSIQPSPKPEKLFRVLIMRPDVIDSVMISGEEHEFKPME